jgi:hypothetical protein
LPRRVLLPLLLAASLLPLSAARALTITVNGTAGASGAGVDGGPGGPADADAISGDPTNMATANGGLGGSATNANGGEGGAATANAETNVGAPATARATANGGRGGNSTGAAGVGGDGGDATAEAHATGAGGSVARAIATGGNGGSATTGALSGGNGGGATLDGAVSGSDSTALVLEQTATGGDGGGGSLGSDGGDGGDATSIGDFTNAAGGDLSVTLRATAGVGAPGFTGSGTGGTARVGGSATSSGSGDASIEATARGTTLALDPLLAHATGSGDASASLDAQQLSDDVDLSLTNALDAVAAGGGAVTLRQGVSADGDTESVLDVTRSASLLALEANAEGGNAAISVRGSNDAGDVRLGGRATGGEHPESAPFIAVAEFQAHTSGDGHDIEIGSAASPAGATGGASGSGVRGGDAEVVATATALGNSAVFINVTAEGGPGQERESGAATVRAEGTGGGTEAVDVTAAALGDFELYAIGGNADAEAIANGLGAVSALAIAEGGVHDSIGPGGSGFARARAGGASGVAEAVARTATLFDGEDADDEQIGRIEVGLAASVAGETAVAAASSRFDFLPGSNDPAFDGYIRSLYQPDASTVAAAVAGNPLAAAAPPPPDDTELFSLVELGATSSGGAAQTFTATITIGDPGGFGEYDDVPEGILVSFLDPVLDAAAFGSLTLRSFDEQDPGDVYEVTFANALDALGFLDDGRLVFAGEPTLRHLEIIFETTGADGAFFLDLIVQTVPEPSALALLALAALALRSVVASRPS